jgi:hypothetical protein
LFLRLIRQPAGDVRPPLPSTAIGVGLVLLGAGVIAVSAWQHVSFCRGLVQAQRPARYGWWFGVWVSAVVAVAGAALAVYLVWSIPPAEPPVPRPATGDTRDSLRLRGQAPQG